MKKIASSELKRLQQSGARVKYLNDVIDIVPKVQTSTKKIQTKLSDTIGAMAEEIQDKIEQSLSMTGEAMAKKSIDENLSKIGQHMAENMKVMVKKHLSDVAFEMSKALKDMESALKDMESAMKDFIKLSGASNSKTSSMTAMISETLLMISETNQILNDFRSIPDEIKKEINNKPEEKLKEFDIFVTGKDGNGHIDKVRVKQIQ